MQVEFLENTLNEVQDNSSGRNDWLANMYGDYVSLSNSLYFIPGTAKSIDPLPLILDSDRDGIPDWFEELHGLNNLIDDSGLDPDNDGYTNIEEYYLGTDPFVNDVSTPSTVTLPATTETETITTISSLISTTTKTHNQTDTITKTAESFGIVLLVMGLLSLIAFRRKWS